MSELPNDVIEISQTIFKIPDCCKEGWDSCPHVTKRDKKERGNIAL